MYYVLAEPPHIGHFREYPQDISLFYSTLIFGRYWFKNKVNVNKYS